MSSTSGKATQTGFVARRISMLTILRHLGSGPTAPVKALNGPYGRLRGPTRRRRRATRPMLAGVFDLTALDLDEIATALADQTDYEHHWLINSLTGQILFWTRDTGIDGQHPVDLDELEPNLVVIDSLPSYVWYQDMADFEQISDDHAGRRLARAIQGRGAFRRFKDELHEEYPELLPTWYAFRDVRAKRRAVEWLLDNSLIDQNTADGYLADHPDPQLP